LGIGEYDGTHVTAVRHQAGAAAKGPLTGKKRIAQRLLGSDAGGQVTHFFVADARRNVAPVEQYLRPLEFDVEIARHFGYSGLVCRVDTLLQAGQRAKPVECPAVEHRPPQNLGHTMCNGALAGRSRAVNSYDGGE